MIAVASGIAASGPGRDDDLSGAWWGAGAAAVAIVAALVTLSVARSHTLHGGTAIEGR